MTRMDMGPGVGSTDADVVDTAAVAQGDRTLEGRAMIMATAFQQRLRPTVEDIYGTQSCDLICRRGDEVKHVDVKGPQLSAPRSSLPQRRQARQRTNAPPCLSQATSR
jgi:hypothetical protein